MKKWTMAFVSVLLTLTLLVGCTPASTPTTTGNVSPSSTVKDDPTTPSSTAKDDPTTPSSTVKDDPTTPSSTVKDDPTTPSSTVKDDPTTPSSTVKDDPTTPSGPDGDDPVQDTGFEPAEQLVKELEAYLKHFPTDWDYPRGCLETRLDAIKAGRQPVYVKFDPDAYYFVCLYNESGNWGVDENFTWIAFETASEIPETYRGLNFAFAFQLNKAEHAWDITDETKAEVFVEHYNVFWAKFENGYNTKSATTFDEALIFSKSDKQYCCISDGDHIPYDIPCIELDGQGYVVQYLNFIDGQIDQSYLKEMTGKYYSCVLERMLDDYYITNKNVRYAKITFEDIAEILTLETPEVGFTPDEQLVRELKRYLVNTATEQWALSSTPTADGRSTAEKLDLLKNAEENRLLYAKLDPDDYYFVCAYCAQPCENEESIFCCIDSYVWVSFRAQGEIPESYMGNSFVAAFQINRSAQCRDLLDGTEASLESYRRYTPQFGLGYNIAWLLKVEDTLLFTQCTGDDSRLYACLSDSLHTEYDLPYIELDGQGYVTIALYRISEGVEYAFDLQEDLGEYYGAIMERIVRNGEYVTEEDDVQVHYGLLKIEDIPALIGD